MKPEHAKSLLENPYFKAFADGKAVEFFTPPNLWEPVKWWNFHEFNSPTITRLKPEPRLRAWKPEEVPVGALLRFKARHDRMARSLITWVNSEGFGGVDFRRDFAEAAFDAGGDEHSTDNGVTWKPCGVEEAQ